MKKSSHDHSACDMRGMLSFMILWLLSRKSMYGQELAQEIGKRKGEKPNPGTIYPCLKDLSTRRLVRVRQDGRSTVYELTKQGKVSLTDAQKYFMRAYGEIFYSTKRN
ncbi:MAG: PadR family transcriptional regulator [Nitrososphaerales archaeon]